MAETKELTVDQLRSIISAMALENAQELAQLKVTNTELQVRLNAALEQLGELSSGEGKNVDAGSSGATEA